MLANSSKKSHRPHSRTTAHTISDRDASAPCVRAGLSLGAKPVTAEIVEQVLSRAIDDLEPTLTRNGYDAAALATQLNARPSDIRSFLVGTLAPEHSHELTEQLLRQAGDAVTGN